MLILIKKNWRITEILETFKEFSLLKKKIKMNKKCIIFASHIPTPNKLYVGKQFLDKFVESFHDYDIYIGINNSCDEWAKMIEDYSDKLNIFYEITPLNLLINSDASAYQTALRLLKK